MPRKSKLKLPPLNQGDETVGQRLAKLRKGKGYTQVELAEEMGIIQTLVSDYERNKIRPHHEMIVRFASALGVTTDEILGFKSVKSDGDRPPPKFLKRLSRIEELPVSQQKFILRVIDSLLKAAQK